jgi:hypothetical protein
MPDLTPEPSPSLTREQVVQIVCRLFAAYLLFWVVVDIIELPRQTLDVVHLLNEGSAMGRSVLSAVKASFTTRIYILYLAANILRITLWLMAAGWFYRCGPRIQRFFAAE